MKKNSASTNLSSLLENYNLVAHITVPTRLNACIDQIASNVNKAKPGIHHLGLSNHDAAQSLTLPVNFFNAFRTWFEYKRDYSYENVQKFCECLLALSFSDAMYSTNVTDAFNFISMLHLRDFTINQLCSPFFDLLYCHTILD